MSYNIIITHVPPQRARSVLARHLAQDPAISLTKALEFIQNVPFVYSRDLTREQAAREIAGLKKMGIQLRLEETQKQAAPPELKKNIDTAAPENHTSSSDEENEQAQSKSTEPSVPSAEHSSGTVVEPEKALLESPGQPDPDSPAREHHPQNGDDSYGHKKPDHTGESFPSHLSATKRNVRKNGFSEITPRKKKRVSKTIILLRSALLLLLIAGVGYLMYKADENKRYKIASDGPVLVKKKGAGAAHSSSRAKGGKASEKKASARVPVGPVEKAQANMYVDSAAQAVDIMKTINFYKIALSFNQYNMDAWFGLINAYKNAGMHRQAREAEERVREIFGDDIRDIRMLVGRFGRLTDVAGPVDGSLRVTYKTTTVSGASLEKETFLLARALGSLCGCKTLIIFASTAKGAGLLARVSVNNFPDSFSEYQSQARLTYAR